jgi:hypothetical protein
MIRHAVLLVMKPNTPPEKTAEMVDEIRGMPNGIPMIREWQVGLGSRPGNATVGIIGLFEDLDTFSQYMEHPEHKRVAGKYIVPIMESGTQVQFEV